MHARTKNKPLRIYEYCFAVTVGILATVALHPVAQILAGNLR